MYLPELLKSVGKNYQRVHVKGICFDSRKAKKNDIFFAIKGNKIAGTKFIQNAILKQVSAIVVDSKIKFNNLKIPLIDIHTLVFKNQDDPLSLFALKKNGHYNLQGYKLVSEEIDRFFLKNYKDRVRKGFKVFKY